MIKRSLLILVAFMLYSTALLAQNWTFSQYLPAAPDTINNNTGVQYLTVDNNDRIWVNIYASVGDSLFVPDSGKYKVVRPVLVFNPDGTLWNKFVSVTFNGVLYPFYGTGYGIDKDHNGNIILVKGGTVYRINAEDGSAMNEPLVPFAGNSVCSPAIDDNGNIYLGMVLPGNPLKKYDADFVFSGNVADTVGGYGRYVEVSGDGFTVYAPRYTLLATLRYRTDSEFNPYSVDTVLSGAAIESGTWDVTDPTKLWFSVGSNFSPPTGDFAAYAQTWLKFDTTDWSFSTEETIKWVGTTETADERPRGIEFSLDGTKAYVTQFGSTIPHPVQVFSKTTGVEADPNLTATDYTLSQNYPNPFNPSTEIKFSVKDAGMVTLKVYDMLGNEIATLVNETLNNGSYRVNFNASDLASGTYVYRLSVNGVQMSNKMMLMK